MMSEDKLIQKAMQHNYRYATSDIKRDILKKINDPDL